MAYQTCFIYLQSFILKFEFEFFFSKITDFLKTPFLISDKTKELFFADCYFLRFFRFVFSVLAENGSCE
jgi:hypothetical protein